jgi:cellulose synthase/poly-beta-1,6-N-acetylglucosamine synthase-like glycosyltransferase
VEFLVWLGTGFAALAVAGGAIVILLTAGHGYLVALHLALRHKGLAEEKRRLTQPPLPAVNLPHVVVQIPVYNEGALVERAATACAKLDWPKDRLHIQICDDSTDGTTDVARTVCARLSATGVNIVLLHRPERAEFKAGALRAGMAASPHVYFAIFDVDYVPPPDFLRRCMGVLLADPALAFVQARPDFLNAEENSLTRAQALALDAHHVIDQATRSWAGHPLPFNGTCGIWRRAAIEAGGGWRGETVAEDLDLSYRAWLAGWRGIFLVTVTAPGELPAARNAFAAQQRRWNLGSGQVAMKMLPRILHTPGLSLRARFGALLHYSSWWVGPAWALTFLSGPLAMLFQPALLTSLGPAFLALTAVGTLDLLGQYRLANRFLHGKEMRLSKFLQTSLTILLYVFYLIWLNSGVAFKAIRGEKSAFERTAKRGHAVF